jgi:hypothetical protein
VLPDGVAVPPWGVAVLPCGVAVLPDGVAVWDCPAALPVLEPVADPAVPPAPPVCAATQVADASNADPSNVDRKANLVADIRKPPASNFVL